MFTGIIEEVGKIKQIKHGKNSAELFIEAETILEGTKIGDSIAVNGLCLTVTKIFPSTFSADVMSESLKRSALGNLKANDEVNLERAMQLGGRFGGHIVSGHVDGTGTIIMREKKDIAVIFTVSAEPTILKYIIEKGSVAVDGVSLTVVAVNELSFSFSMIPHTLEHTALKNKTVGSLVNLETDTVGKYIERFLLTDPEILERCTDLKKSEKNKTGLNAQFLAEHGFL